MRRLVDPTYMAFPFRIGADGGAVSRRRDHVREQIEQVLFTDPGERVFRPLFGAGVRRLIFEPNAARVRAAAEQRLAASLTEALQGEVDPRTLEVRVEGVDAAINVLVAYRLATVDQSESHAVTLDTEAAHG